MICIHARHAKSDKELWRKPLDDNYEFYEDTLADNHTK